MKEKKISKVWIVVGILLFLGILGALAPNDTSQPSPQAQQSEPKIETEKPSTKSVSRGEEGYLHLEDSTVVPVCTTRDNLNELIDASLANDNIGYSEILYSDKCFVVSTLVDSEKLVLVIDLGVGVREFRFVDPESLHYAETAWTHTEFIIPK